MYTHSRNKIGQLLILRIIVIDL